MMSDNTALVVLSSVEYLIHNRDLSHNLIDTIPEALLSKNTELKGL